MYVCKVKIFMVWNAHNVHGIPPIIKENMSAKG